MDAAVLEAPATGHPVLENLAEGVHEVAEAGVSMVDRLTGRKPAAAAITGERLGKQFAEVYGEALRTFKANSDVTEAENLHAGRELASLAADAVRQNLAIAATKSAAPAEGVTKS